MQLTIPDAGRIPRAALRATRSRFAVPRGPSNGIGGFTRAAAIVAGRTARSAGVGAQRAARSAGPAALLLSAVLDATPAAAEGIAGTVPGRVGGSMAALIALAGAVTGALALRRVRRAGTGDGDGHDGAIVALVLGLVGTILAAVHLVTAVGGVGTGSGKAGAAVGAVLGITGIALGRTALVRSRRAPIA